MRLRYNNVDHTEVVDDENGSTIAWDPEKDQPGRYGRRRRRRLGQSRQA